MIRTTDTGLFHQLHKYGWCCNWIFLLLFIYTTTALKNVWWSLGLQSADIFIRPESLHSSTITFNPSTTWNYRQALRHENPSSDTNPNKLEAVCSSLEGLTPGQVKFCQLYPDHMVPVSRGAKMGIEECQWQFRWRRWNCSTVSDGSVFGPSLDIGSTEAAYAHAILSAGVVHSLSRACRDGEIASCGCSKRSRPRNLPRDWLWGGCGDNTDYGYRFAQGFVDIREKEKNYPRHSKQLARMLMNIHNNEVGRRAVLRQAKLSCKCHGVSGSCTIRTCWHQLPNFRLIGDYLTQTYDQSTTTLDHHVTFNKPGTSLIRQQAVAENKGGSKRRAVPSQSDSSRGSKTQRIRERKDSGTLAEIRSDSSNLSAKVLQQNRNNKKNININNKSNSTSNNNNRGLVSAPSSNVRYDRMTPGTYINSTTINIKSKRNMGGSYVSGHTSELVTDTSRRVQSSRPTKDQLVYLEPSPNYCLQNPQLGTVGTEGRRCRREGEGPDGCHVICCGRGYNTESIKRVERCRCKFVWCCEVHCEECETTIDINTCK